MTFPADTTTPFPNHVEEAISVMNRERHSMLDEINMLLDALEEHICKLKPLKEVWVNLPKRIEYLEKVNPHRGWDVRARFGYAMDSEKKWGLRFYQFDGVDTGHIMNLPLQHAPSVVREEVLTLLDAFAWECMRSTEEHITEVRANIHKARQTLINVFGVNLEPQQEKK